VSISQSAKQWDSGLDGNGLILDRGKRFLFSAQHPDWLFGQTQPPVLRRTNCLLSFDTPQITQKSTTNMFTASPRLQTTTWEGFIK
jgi:hypothetical protein